MEKNEIDFEMTKEEQAIVSRIHMGRVKAVPANALAYAAGVSTTRARQVIKHLIEDHGLLICSATGVPAGYFYPETKEEYKAGVNQLVHRIISLAKRVRAMDQESFEGVFGQLKLL